MASSTLPARFVTYIIASLVTHLLELAASGLFCQSLAQHTSSRASLTSVALGLFLIPLVAVQLTSAVFHLRRHSHSPGVCKTLTTALLHLLQLGFIARHLIILREACPSSKKVETWEIMLLRLLYVFSSGATMLLLQLFILFDDAGGSCWLLTLYIAAATNLISITWAIGTFRRRLPDAELGEVLLNWPGTFLKMIWRAGELFTRVTAAALFSSLYFHYLLLALGLHWVTMFVCLHIPLVSTLDCTKASRTKRALMCTTISLVYIFVFMNTGSENSVLRYTLYYMVFFLENLTLLAVWLTQSTPAQFSQNSAFAYTAAISYILALAAAVVYHKRFHVATSQTESSKSLAISSGTTLNIDNSATFSTSSSHPRSSKDWPSSIDCSVTAGQIVADSDNKSFHFSGMPLATSFDLRNTRGVLIGYPVQMMAKQEVTSRNETDTSFSLRVSDKEQSVISYVENNNHSVVFSSTSTTTKNSFSSPGKKPVWLPNEDSQVTNNIFPYSLENFDSSGVALSNSEQFSVDSACTNSIDRSTPQNNTLPSVDHKTSSQLDIVSVYTYETDSSINGDHFDQKILEKTRDSPNTLFSKMYADKRQCPPSKGYCQQMSKLPRLAESESSHKGSQCELTNQSFSLHQKSHKSMSNNRTQDSSCIQHKSQPLIITSQTTQDSETRQNKSIVKLKKPPQETTRCPEVLHSFPSELETSQQFSSNALHAEYLLNKSNTLKKSTSMNKPTSDNKSTSVNKPTSDNKSTSVNKSTSNESTNMSKSTHVKIPSTACQFYSHSYLDQSSKDNADVMDGSRLRSLADCDRLAKELLKSSDPHYSNHSSDKSYGDPRLTARVLTSPVTKDIVTTSDDTNHLMYSHQTLTKQEGSSTKCEEKGDDLRQEQNYGIYPSHTINTEIVNNVYKDSPTVTSRRKNNKSADIDIPALLDSHADQGESVYESLWLATSPANESKLKVDLTVHSKLHQDTVTRDTQGVRSNWGTQSESEDSAFPQEVLSSCEGFTASDTDSNLSFEFVI